MLTSRRTPLTLLAALASLAACSASSLPDLPLSGAGVGRGAADGPAATSPSPPSTAAPTLPGGRAPEAGSAPREVQTAFPKTTSIWPTRDIPVCWETAGYDTDKALVRDQIDGTWGASSGLTFRGWGLCTSGAPGIHIVVEDDGPRTLGLGTALDGAAKGMLLNFTFAAWSPSCQAASSRELCIRSIATHEFGHALGFAHEQNRSDTPSDCKDAPQGTNGDMVLGAYDADSIMNYCNKARWRNGAPLSAGDVSAAQYFYGKPASGGGGTPSGGGGTPSGGVDPPGGGGTPSGGTDPGGGTVGDPPVATSSCLCGVDGSGSYCIVYTGTELLAYGARSSLDPDCGGTCAAWGAAGVAADRCR